MTNLDQPQNACGAGAQARTVLVIEDSEVIRRVISLLLEGEGYHVVSTDQGLEALHLAREWHPDAVTLDLALADTDGRDILRRLKHDAETRAIPVLVMSAFTEALNPTERWYAADVIPKPFDVDDLLQRLGRVVEAGSTGDAERCPDESISR